MIRKIKILLVDDQKLFIQSLKTILEINSNDIDVVGIAHDGQEAIELTEKLKPSIILMDVHMPNKNGVEASKIILGKNPKLKIMMLATFDEEEYVREALQYGVCGYLLKDISPEELIASIYALNKGAIQISPVVAEKLVKDKTDKEKKLQNKFEWFDTLSKREKEIFYLIAEGFDNRQIKEKLFISEQTVRNYVHVIYSKLNVENRLQIIQMAKDIEKYIK